MLCVIVHLQFKTFAIKPEFYRIPAYEWQSKHARYKK